MTALLAEHPQIRGAAVERIQVETFHESMRLQGHTPANADEAQYALAFPLAALVVRGQVGPLEVTGAAIHAADILAVSRCIEIVEADDLSARFPNEILSRVSVTLKDGQRFASPITAAKGDPATAMSPAEFSAKFHLLAGVSLDAERRQAIEQAVAELPASADCATLFQLLFKTESVQALPGSTRPMEIAL
jgi:2-methylcitrate dehydratase PrpD